MSLTSSRTNDTAMPSSNSRRLRSFSRRSPLTNDATATPTIVIVTTDETAAMIGSSSPTSSRSCMRRNWVTVKTPPTSAENPIALGTCNGRPTFTRFQTIHAMSIVSVDVTAVTTLTPIHLLRSPGVMTWAFPTREPRKKKPRSPSCRRICLVAAFTRASCDAVVRLT